MTYTVLARKWRPKRFADMVGQTHVLRALINALDSNRLHHAYLFTGTRGVGKTTIARIFAKSLNCEQGVSSQPCGQCAACTEIDAGRYVDLIEVDAASRTGVDDTRELLDNVAYMPVKGRYKVYLIDEVHMFSKSSFNALLKTLEEPPAHVKFLLATTDPQKLPVTVLSRCLQFNLRALSPAQITGHLAHVLRQESIEFDSAGLNAIAMAANGSMRDALSLLDQAIAFGGGRVERDAVVDMLGLTDHAALLDILRYLAAGDAPALFATLEQVMARAVDPASILAQLLELLHEIGLQQFLPQKNESADDPFAQARNELAAALDPEQVQLWYQIALTGRRDLPYASSPRAGLEMTLLRMLAFLPSSAGAKTAISRAAAASAAAPRTSPAQASMSPTSAKAAISSLEPKPIEASEPASAQLAPETTVSVTSAVASADASWEQIIPQLGLKGPFRALAEHCVLRREDGQASLVMSAEYAGAATEAIRSRLIEATSAFLGMPVKFVESGQSAMPTPAANRSQREAAARERARQELDESPAVQVLKQRAGASMIEDTLQLSDKEPTKE